MGDHDGALPADLRWLLAIWGAAAMLLAVPIAVAAFWKNGLYAEVVPFWILAVLFGLQAAPCYLPSGQIPAEPAERTSGRPAPSDGLDGPSRVLLRRAQDAIGAVISSEVCAAGLMDRAAVSTALARQESDIAAALREQARLRARRAELTAVGAGPVTTAVSGGQIQAAQLAESSAVARVEALEDYAAEVAEADAAYRDRRQAARLAELHDQHLDMLARTAADEHGMAEIATMSQHARVVNLALREPPAW